MIVILISLGLTFILNSTNNLDCTRIQLFGLFLMMLSVTNSLFWLINIRIKPLLNFKENYNAAFIISSTLIGVGQLLQLCGGK